VEYKKIVHIKQEPLSFSTLPIGSWNNLPDLLGEPIKFSKWYYLDGDLYLVREELDKLQGFFTSKPEKIGEMLDLIDKHSQEFMEFCESHKKSSNLLESLKSFMRLYNNFGANAVIMLALEEVIRINLEEQLRRHFNKEREELQKIMALLSNNSKESNTIKEKKDLLKLALKYNPDKLRGSEEIRNHLEKYSWLNCKFLRYTPYKEEEIIERIVNIPNPGEELKKIENNARILEEELNTFLQQIKQDGSLLRAIEDMQTICFLRTNRVEAINYGCFNIHWLFEEIGKFLNIDSKRVPFYLYGELIEGLENKKVVDVEERTKEYVIIAKEGSIKILTGVEAEKVKNEFETDTPSKVVKGLIASKGIAQGTVRIIKSASEINKLNRGEVLVTPMTTPDFVMAMEKAGAIITDLGGLTSHAAIISRELGIPCIVGTENVTKILKDGDFVVVDALEKGEVLKVERNRFGIK